MKKKMIPLLLLLPLLFLLAVYGKDSKKEESRVVVIAIDGLRYLNAAHQNDQFIRQLWECCQQDPFYKGNTTFLITCDHGRGESLGVHANRGEVDVPPLLCRFPARCLGCHSCRHALARHLLLPISGDGHPGFTEMDC